MQNHRKHGKHEHPSSNRQKPVSRLWLAPVLLLALGWTRVQEPPVQDAVQNPVEKTRMALEKWVETRKLISKEKRDWALGKVLLVDRIDLLKDTIATLEKKTTDAIKSVGEAGKLKARREKENNELKRATQSLLVVVGGMEKRLIRLLDRLPQPLRETVRPLRQRLPRSEAASKVGSKQGSKAATKKTDKPGEATKASAASTHKDKDSEKKQLSLGQRFMNIVGILNEIDKYQREIHVGSEVMKLPGGQMAEVTTLYLGISYGFYVSQDRKYSGTGTATDTGWEWIPSNAAAGQVADAIAIYKNEKGARYVPLPVRIR